MTFEQLIKNSLGCFLIILSTSLFSGEALSYDVFSTQLVTISNESEKTENLNSNDSRILNKISFEESFPDHQSRIDFQKDREKYYRSGLAKLKAERQLLIYRNKPGSSLTDQERDAFDYLYGRNFYKHHQDLKTSPNRFDTRKSFLLKMKKNPDMRRKFLENYNKSPTL